MTTSITKINKLAIAILWIVLWQLVAMAIDEELLFASPISVAVTFSKLCVTLDFWKTILFSVLRVLGGFIIGLVVTTTLAVLSKRFQFLRAFLNPAITVIKATPVASFIILALFFIGKDLVPLFIVTLMVAPIVWNNVLGGLDAVDINLLEMATVYDMPFAKKVRHIYLPSIRPYITSAVGSGLGLCWKAGIAAEVICRATPSIGNYIWETKYYFETAEMFTWTVTVILLSVIFDKLLLKLFKGGAKK